MHALARSFCPPPPPTSSPRTTDSQREAEATAHLPIQQRVERHRPGHPTPRGGGGMRLFVRAARVAGSAAAGVGPLTARWPPVLSSAPRGVFLPLLHCTRAVSAGRLACERPPEFPEATPPPKPWSSCGGLDISGGGVATWRQLLPILCSCLFFFFSLVFCILFCLLLLALPLSARNPPRRCRVARLSSSLSSLIRGRLPASHSQHAIPPRVHAPWAPARGGWGRGRP